MNIVDIMKSALERIAGIEMFHSLDVGLGPPIQARSNGTAEHLSERDRAARCPIRKVRCCVSSRPAGGRVVNYRNRAATWALKCRRGGPPLERHGTQPRRSAGFFVPLVFRAFSFLRQQLGLQEYRKLDLPRRSADVIHALSRSEKQFGGLLPRMPRLGLLW